MLWMQVVLHQLPDEGKEHLFGMLLTQVMTDTVIKDFIYDFVVGPQEDVKR